MTPRHDPDQFCRRSGSDTDLLADLRHVDPRPYGFYKSMIEDQDYNNFQLLIDRVQSDLYAPPSAIRMITVPKTVGLPEEALGDGRSRLATTDFLAQVFDSAIAERARGRAVRITRPGQEILQRSNVTVMSNCVRIHFQVQLPARGRSVLGRETARIFDTDAPNIVMDAFDFIPEDEATTAKRSTLLTHIAVCEDYRTLQDILVEKNWVAFVIEGSILARRSGVSQSPMEDAVPFESPESLRCAVTLPHAGEITGMTIEPGVTPVVGDGYHGKSTFLSTLQRGVYAHIPGDGRKLVATTPDVTRVRAADGHAITTVNVSAFIMHLLTGANTRVFSTENASSSISQAAVIMEAVELDSPLLLIDEDTSATNLLIRDERMRTLVTAEKRPITPLVDGIGALVTSGMSVVMAMGGSGDYLDVTDRVLMLDSYRRLDVSERAREVVATIPRRLDNGGALTMPARHVLTRQYPNTERPKTKSPGLGEIVLNRRGVSLFSLEQIVSPGQTEAITWAMCTVLEELANSQVALPDLLKRFQWRLDSEGLDTVAEAGAHTYPAFFARPRMVDISAALNHYRGLRI